MNKKGFFAISLIYSFFVVFLTLMVTILAQNMNSSVLVGKIKEDIRDDLLHSRELFVSKIEDGYVVGDSINLAGEEWMVLKNNGASYVLVLNRALRKSELINSLGLTTVSNYKIVNGAKNGYDATEFYGTCDEEEKCQLRACRNTANNIEFCYLYTNGGTTNENLHRNPTWKMNLSSSELSSNFGTTIVSKAVNIWFDNHQGLQRLRKAKKLVGETTAPYILDGTTLGTNHKITGFVRLPYSSEFSSLSSLVQDKLKKISPIHLTDVASGVRIKLYQNGSVVNAYSNSAAYVRPVIEVLKDLD